LIATPAIAVTPLLIDFRRRRHARFRHLPPF